MLDLICICRIIMKESSFRYQGDVYVTCHDVEQNMREIKQYERTIAGKYGLGDFLRKVHVVRRNRDEARIYEEKNAE